MLGMSGILLLSSCGNQIVQGAPNGRAQTNSNANIITVSVADAQQVIFAKAKITKVRSLAEKSIDVDLDWNTAKVVNYDLLYVQDKVNKSTYIFHLAGENTNIMKLEASRSDSGLLVKTSILGTNKSRTDKISSDGTVTEIARTTDTGLKAQATCAEVREEIHDLREGADADNETAFWFGVGGLVALETAPVAGVAALAASRYRSKAIEKTNEANRLKSIYTNNCA